MPTSHYILRMAPEGVIDLASLEVLRWVFQPLREITVCHMNTNFFWSYV